MQTDEKLDGAGECVVGSKWVSFLAFLCLEHFVCFFVQHRWCEGLRRFRRLHAVNSIFVESDCWIGLDEVEIDLVPEQFADVVHAIPGAD